MYVICKQKTTGKNENSDFSFRHTLQKTLNYILRHNRNKKRINDLVGAKESKLTYNCAHIRSTKESLIFEYLEKENIFIAKKEENN